jgi:hypothetical protein
LIAAGVVPVVEDFAGESLALHRSAQRLNLLQSIPSGKGEALVIKGSIDGASEAKVKEQKGEWFQRSKSNSKYDPWVQVHTSLHLAKSTDLKELLSIAVL